MKTYPCLQKKKKVLRGKARVMRLVYPYTKYDTFLLIHVFKTNLSNFFFLNENYDTRPMKKMKTYPCLQIKSLFAWQSVCDEANMYIYIYIYMDLV